MDAKIQSFYGQWLEKYILILTLHKEESYHREAHPLKVSQYWLNVHHIIIGLVQ